MKRAGSLFDTIFTRDNLYAAYLQARDNKRSTRACYMFERNLGGNLAKLLDEIHGNSYRPRPYHLFTVYEPKQRVIHAPAFRDRVVQHAIYQVIYPIFDRSFLVNSCACRVGFGTHRASRMLHQAMRQCSADDYYLQLDVRKFFYSIDRAILRTLVERKIKDRRLVDLMVQFADDSGPVGIPIGNLLSQLFALIYLSHLDHFVKRGLKVRHYVRYVDDFVLVGLSRDDCLKTKARIETFLADNLRLRLSKSTIQRIGKGINFVGYRHWRGYKLVRKHSLYTFRRNLRAGRLQAVASTMGHARGTASMPRILHHIRASGLAAQMPKAVRREYHLLDQGAPP